MNKRFTLFLLVLLSPIATVASPNFSDQNSVANGFLQFINGVTAAVNNVLTTAAVQADVNLLWTFFALFLVIWTMYQYAFGKGQLVDLLSAAILIMIVKVLMSTFAILVDGIWEAANGFASAVQQGLIGTPDLFFAPTFIAKLLNSISWDTGSTLGFVSSLIMVFSVGFITMLTTVLSALSYIAVIWAFWGYSISKLIGLLFIPFLMYERLSWLFDGWLRFFFGFIFYAVIARINIALVAIALANYFGLSTSLGAIVTIDSGPISQLSQLLGIAVFTLVGIIATLSTGSFVAALVGGSAQSSGVGRLVSLAAFRSASALLKK